MTNTNGSGATADDVNAQIARIKTMAAEVTRQAAQKLIDQSAANVVAAEDVLRMLKEEHASMATEVMRLSENHAHRLIEYLTTVHNATMTMAGHREAMMTVAQAVTDNAAPREQ